MSPLEHFAARCAREPMFLAFALAASQRHHGLNDELLADALGCSLDILARLRLCGRPRVNCYAADCRQVAEKLSTGLALAEICHAINVETT